MTERLLKSLYDIRIAMDEITSFFENRSKVFEVYKRDVLLKRGIERNLEIIGEAMSRILTEDATVEIRDARRIVDLRNQIIHGYDAITDERIWAIVINHLPKLKEDVDVLIGTED